MYQIEDSSHKSKPRAGDESHDAEYWSSDGVKMHFTGSNVK